MIVQSINGIEYKLREAQDFSWLNNYGKVFSVVDETGSGCICFGVRNNNKNYFYKIAGAKTVEAEVDENESIELLKKSISIYKDIKNENLIKLVDYFAYNEFYVAVFEYADGECLFDHWNFDKYKNNPNIVTPKQRFNKLEINKKINVSKRLISFFESVIDADYLAVDFYDSSIIYDFEKDIVSFCDIDLFRKAPTYNDIGEKYFGTSRLKAPEENILGSIIDEKTNLFTLAAIIFDIFSDVNNILERRKIGMFIPNKYEEFQLNKKTYDVLVKATSYDRDNRYSSIKEFEQEFINSLD